MNTKGNPLVGGAPFQRVISISGIGSPNSVFGIANKSNRSLGGLISLSTDQFKLEPSVWSKAYGESRSLFESNIRSSGGDNLLLSAWRYMPAPFLSDRARWIVQFL